MIETCIPKIEQWQPESDDILITNQKNAIRMPICKMLNLKSDVLDVFIVRTKKCYNSDVLRNHVCQVINFFEKFYDTDKELLAMISHIKYKIDAVSTYSRAEFINDVRVYVLNPSIKNKVTHLAQDNYNMLKIFLFNF
jgi:hypothetical protein